jgi:predicted membrane protein
MVDLRPQSGCGFLMGPRLGRSTHMREVQMRRDMHRQRGMTFIGWMIILGLIAFFTLLGLKIIPIYLENYKMKSILESLKEEPLITQKTPREIMKLLRRRFNINYVDTYRADDIVKIKKEGGKVSVEIIYEHRANVLGNLDVVASFHDGIEIIAN